MNNHILPRKVYYRIWLALLALLLLTWGLAQINLGQLDAALDTFARLEKDHPQSEWLSRSRFGRAAALMALMMVPAAAMAGGGLGLGQTGLATADLRQAASFMIR